MAGRGGPGGLTAWQRFVRMCFRVVGPAQVGLPPYATEDERAAARRDATTTRRGTGAVPPGYEIRVYTDAQGIEHRSLVPVTEPPSAG